MSSRGRSRSLTRSPVPKRRRREFSPTIQSRTSSDREKTGWIQKQERVFQSQSPHSARDIKRPRSVSSVSSRTSAHSSRSGSPNLEPRPVHRLPSSDPVTSEPLGNVTRNLQHGKAREPAPQSNGNHYSHIRHDKAKKVGVVRSFIMPTMTVSSYVVRSANRCFNC